MADVHLSIGLNIGRIYLNTSNCGLRFNIRGQGNVSITVNSELQVVIEGQGDVFYRGNLTITSFIIGQGEIIDAN